MMTDASVDPVRAFEMAKEATRRATFLNTAARIPGGASNENELKILFRACRMKALATGATLGHSEQDVDRAIGALWDEDSRRLKGASDDEIRRFSVESGKIVNAFIATLDEQTLRSAFFDQ